MKYEQSRFDLEGWREEDFSDLPYPENLEQDPWEAQPTATEDAAESSGGQTQGVASSLLELPSLFQSTADDIADVLDPVAFTASQDGNGGEFDFQEPESLTKLGSLLGWDEDLPDGDEPSDLFFIADNSHDEYDNEVDPLTDYRSDLREALYELDGAGPQDWVQSIRIDEFISGVGDVSTSQQQEISELLQNLSAPRLSSWLPWLRRREWTGHTLLLFLQFRAFWDESSEFWAFLQWSPGAKYWFTLLSRNSMSLDDSYLLVQRRSKWPAYQLIDIEWFDDWDQIDVWTRVSGDFFSFASFALYRSRLHYGEDWRCRPDLMVDLDSPPINSVADKHGWELLLHTDWARLSFEGEMGTDPMEWHDGHGW